MVHNNAYLHGLYNSLTLAVKLNLLNCYFLSSQALFALPLLGWANYKDGGNFFKIWTPLLGLPFPLWKKSKHFSYFKNVAKHIGQVAKSRNLSL